MRFSYILHNKEGRGRRVPRGEAWQWVHEVEEIDDLVPILDWIDSRVSIDRLSLLNVYLDHTEITAAKNASISFESMSLVEYSRVTQPHRIIDMHAVSLESDRNH